MSSIPSARDNAFVELAARNPAMKCCVYPARRGISTAASRAERRTKTARLTAARRDADGDGGPAQKVAPTHARDYPTMATHPATIVSGCTVPPPTRDGRRSPICNSTDYSSEATRIFCITPAVRDLRSCIARHLHSASMCRVPRTSIGMAGSQTPKKN